MVRRSSTTASMSGRAFLIRHVALCGAALLAYFAREYLQVGNEVLWVLGFAAALNLWTATLGHRSRVDTFGGFLSALLGLGGWTALTFLTGGVSSPFIAGLSLEVMLAIMTNPPGGVILITAWAIAGLWFQQSLLGLSGFVLSLTLHTAFLCVIGAVTGYVGRRWSRREEDLARRQVELQQRLKTLEKELDEARSLGRLGENVARLAHSLKNAAHSLRGFARLMEPRLGRSGPDREVLDGLMRAIDGLEDLARTALGAPGSLRKAAAEIDGAGPGRIVSEVVRDVAVSFPGVKWSLSLEPIPPIVSAFTEVIREVLAIIFRNAAEAMQGHGEVAVAAIPRGGHLQILVRDHGPGIPGQELERVFEPGYTTKPEGDGYGLFLARRLLESRGGLLQITPAAGGGTLCRIELPLVQSRLAG